MADGEVKIHLSADADTTAIDDAARKVDAVKGKAQNPTEANARPASPASPVAAPKPGAADAAWDALEKRRQELLQMRREQRGMERGGDSRGARDVGRRADKLEKDIDREGARLLKVEETEAKKSEQERAQATKQRVQEERAAARERLQAERAATREIKEQQAMQRAGITAIRSAAALVGGAIMAEVLPTIVQHVAARETLGNRGVATAAANDRRLAILSGARGTSGEVAAEGWAAEDRIAERERERPQLETDRKFGTISGALQGAAAGAGVGAAVGSIVPVIGTAIGAGIGTAIGGTIGGVSSWMSGSNKIAQAEQDQAQDEDLAARTDEDASAQFMRTEGGLQMQALRGRAKRSLAGQREVFEAELQAQALATFRDVYAKTKGNSDLAKEAAVTELQSNLRDRQVQAGAGLVDAHTGGAGIAAAAKWGAGQFPQMDDLVSKTGQLLSAVERGNQDTQIRNQAK